MSFLINWNAPKKTTITPTFLPPSQINHLPYKNYKHLPQNSCIEYLCFLDIESDNILGANKLNPKQEYIPAIVQLSMVLCKYEHFKDLNPIIKYMNDESIIKIMDFKDTTSNLEYIEEFLKIIIKYNYPLVISHNGCNFDFRILLSNIIRFQEHYPTKYNYLDIFLNLKFFDTLVAIRLHNKETINLKNGTLFKYYAFFGQYKKVITFVENSHNSVYDTLMLLLWNHTIHHIKQGQFITTKYYLSGNRLLSIFYDEYS